MNINYIKMMVTSVPINKKRTVSLLQNVTAVEGNKSCLPRDPYTTHKMWSERRIFEYFTWWDVQFVLEQRKVKADQP